MLPDDLYAALSDLARKAAAALPDEHLTETPERTVDAMVALLSDERLVGDGLHQDMGYRGGTGWGLSIYGTPPGHDARQVLRLYPNGDGMPPSELRAEYGEPRSVLEREGVTHLLYGNVDILYDGGSGDYLGAAFFFESTAEGSAAARRAGELAPVLPNAGVTYVHPNTLIVREPHGGWPDGGVIQISFVHDEYADQVQHDQFVFTGDQLASIRTQGALVRALADSLGGPFTGPIEGGDFVSIDTVGGAGSSALCSMRYQKAPDGQRPLVGALMLFPDLRALADGDGNVAVKYPARYFTGKGEALVRVQDADGNVIWESQLPVGE